VNSLSLRPTMCASVIFEIRRAMHWLLAACALWLAGCAQPVLAPEGSTTTWSGRLALNVDEQSAQSFSAMFDLQGDVQMGSLALTSPLGNRLAQLEWKYGQATLSTNGPHIQSADSLENLVKQATGAEIPVAALFQWLQGIHVDVPGWRADLSALANGRLTAHREYPAPRATLRIALSR
jgi:outer membrane lipoprotein LolB